MGTEFDWKNFLWSEELEQNVNYIDLYIFN